jgi:hypothetical protein
VVESVDIGHVDTDIKLGSKAASQLEQELLGPHEAELGVLRELFRFGLILTLFLVPLMLLDEHGVNVVVLLFVGHWLEVVIAFYFELQELCLFKAKHLEAEFEVAGGVQVKHL